MKLALSSLAAVVFVWTEPPSSVFSFTVVPTTTTPTRTAATSTRASTSTAVSLVTKTNSNEEETPEVVDTHTHTRRKFFGTAASLATVGVSVATTLLPQRASASGGATAGKYTTIPIAKRRYYGRVQEAVHEFLLMGPDVVKADMTAGSIQDFFDVTKTVIQEAKSTSINGQCTKADGKCKGKEIRDSRYNDMKTSMYLLGNAFRINQTKAPDNLPTVKAAKAFFKEMDLMEKAVVKKPKKNDIVAVQHYAEALRILDVYLDLVELPPTDSGHYAQDFSTLVGESARLT